MKGTASHVAGPRLLHAARVLFAPCVIGWGALCLLNADLVNALEPIPAQLPGYTALALLNGVLLTAVGCA